METTYYYSAGACSLPGQALLEWLGQPYKLVRADRAARQTDGYVKVHPQRKVPVLALDQGARILTENIAILTHLAERKPGFLPPHGSPARDTANQWMSYIATTLHPAFWPHLMPQRYSAYEAHHGPVRATGQARVRAELAVVDQALHAAGHLVGRQLDVVDVYLYSVARWARSFCDMGREFPRVQRLMDEVERDPGVQFALATEKGDAPKSPHCLSHTAFGG